MRMRNLCRWEALPTLPGHFRVCFADSGGPTHFWVTSRYALPIRKALPTLPCHFLVCFADSGGPNHTSQSLPSILSHSGGPTHTSRYTSQILGALHSPPTPFAFLTFISACDPNCCGIDDFIHLPPFAILWYEAVLSEGAVNFLALRNPSS